MNAVSVLILYFVLVNFLGLYAMYTDKMRARKRAFRIPEATLFTIACIGGSIGCIIGMYLFRHKTRHWYFVYGLPAILVLQIALFAAICYGPFQIQIM